MHCSPHPAQSSDTAPSDCHLFSTVKNSQRARHFADDKKFKAFVMCSEVDEGNFALVYSVLLNVGKSELKMTETSWKIAMITHRPDDGGSTDL
jgi:hypothetical protein